MKIAQFLRSYKDHRRDCRESFDAALQKQIAAKEQEYDTLMKNMSVMVLAPDILSDIHEKMKTIKEEIKVLENTTPPEEYSTDVILDWLKSIRTAPDSRAVHLLVQRIDVVSDNEKTDFNVVSTLESVSEKLVAAIGFEASLPLAQGAALRPRRGLIHHRTRSNPIAKKAGHPSGCPAFLVAAIGFEPMTGRV